jgi:hypothetical protein
LPDFRQRYLGTVVAPPNRMRARIHRHGVAKSVRADRREPDPRLAGAGRPGYRFHGLPMWLIMVGHFVMQRKQLLGIATRAETSATSARERQGVLPWLR